MFRACVSKLRLPKLVPVQQWSVSKFSTLPPRDPYSAEAIESQRKAFQTMPSYNQKDQTINATDLFPLCKEIQFHRSKEQVEKYIEYTRINGGKIFLEEFTRYMKTLHNPKLILQEYAVTYDKDKDGFISAKEYDYLIETLLVHDPEAKVATFDVFLEEADTNKDGKVSVEELRQWLRN